MKNLKKSITYPVILTILVLGCLVLYTKQQEASKHSSTWNQLISGTKYPSPTTPSSEFNSNGHYENYAFGFSFDYPEEIFSKSNPWNDQTGKTFFTGEELSPILRVQKVSEDWSSFYETCVNSKDGTVLSQNTRTGTSMKLRSKTNGCVVSIDPRGLKDGEPSWSQVAYFKQDNKFLAVSISADDKKTLENLMPQFNKIIVSFKFIAQ